MSVKPEHQNEVHFLKRRISVDNFGCHVELDQRYVKSLLHAMAMNHCKSMASRNVTDLTEKFDPQEHMRAQRFDIAFSTKETMREAAGLFTV